MNFFKKYKRRIFVANDVINLAQVLNCMFNAGIKNKYILMDTRTFVTPERTLYIYATDRAWRKFREAAIGLDWHN